MYSKCVRMAARCLAIAALFARRAPGQTAVNSNDIYLDQVEYASGAGTDVSPTGQLIINTSDASLSGNYINIADGNGNWLVQNMPVVNGVNKEAAEIPLGTPDGTNDTGDSMKLSVDVTPTPIVTFGSPTVPVSFTVKGEDVEDNGGQGAPGNPGPVAASNIAFSINGQNRLAVELGMPSVQTADNQCGDSALANALTWLKNNKGLNIPDPNVPGRGALTGTLKDASNPAAGNYAANTVLVPGGQPNIGSFDSTTKMATYQTSEKLGTSLVGQLDLLSGRSSNNRAEYFDAKGTDQNEGTSANQQVTAAELYLSNAGDANVVNIDTQGIAKITNGGITDNLLGTTVSGDFLYNEMAVKGAAVKVGYFGHAVNVVATGSILGATFVFLQSDLAQTGVDPLDQNLNTLTNLPDGLTNASSIAEFSYLDPQFQVLTGLSVRALDDIAISVVPEPGMLGACLGGAMLLAMRRRRPNLARSGNFRR
jgi:hypothetical protein